MTIGIVLGIVAAFVGIAIAVGAKLTKSLQQAALTRAGVARVGNIALRYTWMHGTVLELELREALTLALAHLAKVWPPEKLYTVLDNVHINVAPGPRWKNALGDTVAGEAFPGVSTVVIGNDLAALAHELAHLMESGLGRAPVNEGHINWVERGIRAAVDAYEAELRAVRS